MRIGIDCTETVGKPTGVGRFLGAILRGLDEVKTEHEIFLYGCDDGLRPSGASVLTKSIPRRSRRMLEEQIELPRLVSQDRIDLFYTPGYWLPLLVRAPSVFTLHDLAFATHPEWFSPRERYKRMVLARLSAWKAVAIVTGSEFSRNEITERYGLPSDRVLLAIDGVDSQPATPVDAAAFRAERGIVGPLIISIGSLFQRRRTDVLLASFALLLKTHVTARLWVAGENRTFPAVDYVRMASEMGIGDHVTFSGYTDEQTVRCLYRAADVLVYLSEYEGFGLPPMEACACGTPVVTSRGSSLEEIFSACAVLVDPRSPTEVAEAVELVLSDAEKRETIRKHGFALASRHTPRAAAERFLQLVDGIAHG